MKYIAEYLGEQVEVRTNFRNLHTLIERLNKLGFNLGYGHDGIELQDWPDGQKRLVCEPYVGRMSQHITFTPSEER